MAELSSPAFRRLNRLLTSGNLWLYILSLLSRKEEYAYSLPEKIQKKFGFSPSRLMCYLVLYRLEGEGLIGSKFKERRKYYSCTSAGRKLLLQAKSLLKSLSVKL